MQREGLGLGDTKSQVGAIQLRDGQPGVIYTAH